MTDVRYLGVAWMDWMVANQPQIAYTQDAPERLAAIGHPGELPFGSDCSGTSLLVFNWIGAPDPCHATPPYSAGDTETFAAGATGETSATQAIPMDTVIYGLGGPLGVQHMGLIHTPDVGGDPLTMSHGWSGEPAFVRVSVGDPTGGAYGPPRYFRYNTNAVGPIAYPPGYKVKVKPGSYASKVPAKFLPVGTPPTLDRGDPQTNWVVFARLCGREAGVWPADEPVGPGGDGLLTENMTIRFERQQGLAPDGIITPRVWRAFGLVV